MARKKTEIIVDVLDDERGNQYYLIKNPLLNELEPPDGLGLVSGIFLREDDLDEWLEENKKKVKVVEDMREPFNA